MQIEVPEAPRPLSAGGPTVLESEPDEALERGYATAPTPADAACDPSIVDLDVSLVDGTILVLSRRYRSEVETRLGRRL